MKDWKCENGLSTYCPARTCWLGAGEDEGGGAAVSNLVVARVQVDAVNGKRLQAADFCGPLPHLPLVKGDFTSGRRFV